MGATFRTLIKVLAATALLSGPMLADDDDDDDDDQGFGLAGILSAGNKEDLESIELGADIPLTSAPWMLKSVP